MVVTAYRFILETCRKYSPHVYLCIWQKRLVYRLPLRSLDDEDGQYRRGAPNQFLYPTRLLSGG